MSRAQAVFSTIEEAIEDIRAGKMVVVCDAEDRENEGDHVNVEPALQASARLGGHIVQGHVDGIGTIVEAREEGFARVVRIAAPAAILRYVVEKGSIAVDGVSLTVSAVDDEGFEVSLIPETLERTTLGEAATGREVNLEVDVVAKYVEKLVAR